MLKKWGLLKKGSVSQKRLLWGGVGLGMAVVFLFFVVFPMVEEAKRMSDEIALRQRNLRKAEDFLRNRKGIEDDLLRAQNRDEEIQKRLLPGETPQVGAAALQEIARRLGDKNGIVIRSFRMVEPKESVPFRKVSVQIDFNPVNNLLSVGQFINDVENHEKKLMITEMNLLVFNVRMPNNIQGSLVVTGLMNGTKAPEKGTPEKGNEKGKVGKA